MSSQNRTSGGLSPTTVKFESTFILIPFGCAVFYAILKLAIASHSTHQRMLKLGHRAARITSWVPFEIDVLILSVFKLHTNNFFPWTQKLLDGHRRTVEMNPLGRRIILTDDVENIKAVFCTDFSKWIKVDGHEWLASKAQLRGHLGKLRPNDLELSEIEFQHLKPHLLRPEPQDVLDLIDRYQLDVLARIFFGESAGSLSTNDQNFRLAMGSVLSLNTKRIFLGPIAKFVPMEFMLGNSLKTINEYIQRFVDKTMSLSPDDLKEIDEKDKNLVESLVSEGRDSKKVRDQLLAVLLAAKDPSSVVISWTIYALSKNPAARKKFGDEIREHVGLEKPPTANQLKQMTYANCIMSETLRIYHPFGYNIRTASEDMSLPSGGGPNGDQPVAVLRGQQCIYSILSLQYRKEIWGEDAALWNPDRWLDYTPPMWDYIPFNHGPRNCLGRVFGRQQVLYALVRIYQEFDRIELISPVSQRIKIQMNTVPAYPIKCIFHPRNDKAASSGAQTGAEF